MEHVSRDHNKDVDSLSNDAMDKVKISCFCSSTKTTNETPCSNQSAHSKALSLEDVAEQLLPACLLNGHPTVPTSPVSLPSEAQWYPT